MTIVRIGDVQPMGDLDLNAPRPNLAVCWEVRFRGAAHDKIELAYHRVAKYTLDQNLSFDDLISSIVDGSRPTSREWNAPQVNHPKRSKLSIESNQAKYHIFVIEGDNCQFSEQQTPFRIATYKASFFYEARCGWADSSGAPQITAVPPVGIVSKVGYFIAFSNLDMSGVPAPFNIYLDLKTVDGSLVPIAIDPDVGYPGGVKEP